MIKWDDVKTTLYELANESETSGRAFLDLMANQGYKMTLSQFNSEQIEEERTGATVADKREYQMPVDALWLSQLTIIEGTTKYPLVEVKSRDTWESMTSNETTGIPEFYFVQPRKGIGGSLILLEPIPGDVYDFVMVVETTSKDLSNAAYTTGTVSVTKDTDVVTGSGTTFTAPMVGRYIRFNESSKNGDGLWYRISEYTSGTSIKLENYYQGENYSGGTYEICEMFELPEDLHMAPIYYSLWHYYASRRSKDQAAIYRSQYDQLIKDAKERHATKTRDIAVHDFGQVGFMSDYPNYFPSDGVE